jgi:hypothetical protein
MFDLPKVEEPGAFLGEFCLLLFFYLLREIILVGKNLYALGSRQRG